MIVGSGGETVNRGHPLPPIGPGQAGQGDICIYSPADSGNIGESSFQYTALL